MFYSDFSLPEMKENRALRFTLFPGIPAIESSQRLHETLDSSA